MVHVGTLKQVSGFASAHFLSRPRATRLISVAIICLVAGPVPATLFRLPLSSNTSVHYYYDHGNLTDWKCGSETYSGHRGSDFSGGPRGRAIYAAAVGTLSYKIDGFGDGYWGSTDGGGFGNHVRLTHSGGFLTIYGHMTVGSVTTKAVNSSIACGEQIGGVGTSGNSTGFHLHFQVNVNGVADDPYQGACGGPLTYWVNQNNGNPVTTCEGGSGTDNATFISENYPDGSVLSPGEAFVKQFVMNNSGTTTWLANGTNGYTLKHTSDSPVTPNLGAALHTVLSSNVAPGANCTFNIPLTAPITPGTYRANFQMKNSAGAIFGNAVWVNIVVSTPSLPSAPAAAAAVGVTSVGFTANWSSVSGATGYRLDVATNNAFSGYVPGYQNLDVGDVTGWIVSGLNNGANYYYRVRAYNIAGTSANSDTISVTLLGTASNGCVNVLNSNFESGFALAGGGYIANNWTEWENDPGVVIGYDETSIVHGGSHAQRIRVWGETNGSSGGVYQRLPATPGVPYSVSVWAYAGDSMTTCFLGVDPSGGIPQGGTITGVTWTSGSSDVAWVQKTWTGIATANYLTVFYKVASPDDAKRNGYFDDTTPSGKPLQLVAQVVANDLSLSWPECPNARLEQAENLSAPTIWAAVTNQAQSTGGQKRVTLSPTHGAAFFRLVLE